MFREKSILMDADGLHRTLVRMAHEIVEKNKGMEDVKLIGIQRRGVPMARHIAGTIEDVEGIRPEVGTLDITFYRDDLSLRSTHPEVHSTDVPFSINGKTVVLIDDVLYTGRTVRAAIEAIMDMGRPEKIQLAVLVDRGHRELPFRPDFVGKNVPTSRVEMINVELSPIDEQDRIVLMERIQE